MRGEMLALLERLKGEIAQISDIAAIAERTMKIVAREMVPSASSVTIGEVQKHFAPDWRGPFSPLSVLVPFHGDPLFVTATQAPQLPASIVQTFQEQQVSACAVVEIGDRVGTLEVYYIGEPHQWDVGERLFLEEVARIVAERVTQLRPVVAQVASVPAGTAIEAPPRTVLFTLDAQAQIQKISGDTEHFFGLSTLDLLQHPIHSRHLIVLKDRKKLRAQLARATQEFVQELRVVNRSTRQLTWMLVSLRHVGSGWHGVAIEITPLKNSLRESREQAKRLESLLTLASFPADGDSAEVWSMAARAVAHHLATRAVVGIALSDDQSEYRVICGEGISAQGAESVFDAVAPAIDELEDRSGDEPMVTVDLGESQGRWRLVPIGRGETFAGALAIRLKRDVTLSNDDEGFIGAIGLSVERALVHHLEHEDKTDVSMAVNVLYSLTHELSKISDIPSLAQRGLTLISDRIPAKRGWLGVLNEAGTHVVGYAGFGPGIKSRLVQVQVELRLRHDFFDEALRTKQPVLVPAGAMMECSGLNRLIARLDLGFFVVVPILALNNVVGMLVLEPQSERAFKRSNALALLGAVTAELGSVMYARRNEEKIASANKMRMAALLSSGIAHNFNNLLQAIIGQAGLIEVQQDKDAPVARSARLIMDAATRGAALIKQLGTFAATELGPREEIQLSTLLEDSREMYRSILGSSVTMQWEVEDDLPPCSIDIAQVQQIITNLLVNAREALERTPNPIVTVTARRVRVGTAEIDPELPAGEYVRIDVDDNGPGMTSEVMSRCFEPFFTTKNSDRVTGLGLGSFGLGLAAAYAVAKNHGGIITVSSTSGQGAEFSVYLPSSTPPLTKRIDSVRDQMVAMVWGVPPSDEAVVFTALDATEVRRASSAIKLRSLVRANQNYERRIVVIDLDAVGGGVDTVIKELLQRDAQLRFLLIGDDPTPFIKNLPNAHIVARPLGPWNLRDSLTRLHLTGTIAGKSTKSYN